MKMPKATRPRPISSGCWCEAAPRRRVLVFFRIRAGDFGRTLLGRFLRAMGATSTAALLTLREGPLEHAVGNRPGGHPPTPAGSRRRAPGTRPHPTARTTSANASSDLPGRLRDERVPEQRRAEHSRPVSAQRSSRRSLSSRPRRMPSSGLSPFPRVRVPAVCVRSSQSQGSPPTAGDRERNLAASVGGARRRGARPAARPRP